MQTGMVKTNGVELCYETRGPEDGTPVVFVMGLSAQMVFWPEPLLDHVADAGYRVIRFDNRDIGKSSLLREKIAHSPFGAMGRFFAGLPIKAPYTLHDMVADTVGLVDALGHERVHLVGASMGGMISQLMAARHPDRVLSLTSIMSSNNGRWLPPPRLQAIQSLVGPRKPIRDQDEYIEFGFDMMRRIGGKLPQGEQLLREQFARSWERGLHPRGVLQQFMAIMATGPLTPWLKQIQCPTTVIHGAEDPLIRPAGGRASARHIANARLEIIPGMGHDLPESLLPTLGELIRETADGVAVDLSTQPA
jgi:pimeloyl-ACP methyl ester carboxylesterase